MPPRIGRPGDSALSAILAADLFGALAGALVHLTMVWWVLSQAIPDRVVALMVLSIFVPLNLGVILSGVAVTRYGSRRLLIFSKLVAIGGASACGLLLATGSMTLPLLAIVAAITYGAMGPSISADISRVPALTRLSGRRLAGFHAANGALTVLGQIGGLWLAGVLATRLMPHSIVIIGIAMLAISTAITWAAFPRDRLKPDTGLSAAQSLVSMTRSVWARLDGRRLGPWAIFATAAIIATTEGSVEVILPLTLRAFDMPPGALAMAYVAAVVSGIGAAVVAQALHERIPLAPALITTAAFLAAALIAAAAIGGLTGVYIATCVTSAAAWGAGTLTVSTLQEAMPASLQAQAISLWQSLVLTTGALTILITGQIGGWGMWLMVAIALFGLYASARTHREQSG